VKGHIGIERNEKAADLARQGSQSLFIAPEPTLSNGTLKRSVDRWIYSEHRERWTSLTAVDKRVGSGYSRKTLSWILALIADLGNFKYHLSKMKMEVKGSCRLRLEGWETAALILGEFPGLPSIKLRTPLASNKLSIKQMLELTRGAMNQLEFNGNSPNSDTP